MPRLREPGESRAYWDRVARENAEWYVDTGGHRDRDSFFRQGAEEVDFFLHHCSMKPSWDKTVLEIGCGVGRMTRRLSELYGRVLALDVSPEMLARARQNLADRDNVEWILGSGEDLAGIADSSVDHVFSYITLQHVPTSAAVLTYITEAGRALAPGGRAGLQVRRPSWQAAMIDLAAQLARALRGRRTLVRAWRGTRVGTAHLVSAGSASGCRVELRPWRSRHLWVVLTRPKHPQQ